MERRQDTREKIQLGGLVVKAGLRDEDKAFILGVLVEAARRRNDNAYRQRMTRTGDREFSDDN